MNTSKIKKVNSFLFLGFFIFILLMSFGVHSENLNVFAPEDVINDVHSHSNFEYNESRKNVSGKNLSTAKWQLPRGFSFKHEFIDQRDKNNLNGIGFSDMLSSTGTTKTSVNLGFYNSNLKVTGEFYLGQHKRGIDEYAEFISSNKEYRQDDSHGFRNSSYKIGISGKNSFAKYGFKYFRVGDRYEDIKIKKPKGSKVSGSSPDKAGYEYWSSTKLKFPRI